MRLLSYLSDTVCQVEAGRDITVQFPKHIQPFAAIERSLTYKYIKQVYDFVSVPLSVLYNIISV